VANLCAFREKDRRFVAALIDALLVDGAVIRERLSLVPERYRPQATDALVWLEGIRSGMGISE